MRDPSEKEVLGHFTAKIMFEEDVDGTVYLKMVQTCSKLPMLTQDCSCHLALD